MTTLPTSTNTIIRNFNDTKISGSCIKLDGFSQQNSKKRMQVTKQRPVLLRRHAHNIFLKLLYNAVPVVSLSIEVHAESVLHWIRGAASNPKFHILCTYR